MKAPKLLPWIASKAAISDELALDLWRRAAAEAEELAGNRSSDEYYRLAVERLIDLCADESERTSGNDSFATQYAWLRRHQTRLVQLNLLAARNSCRLWLDSWNQAFLGHGEQVRAR
ncbi:MAG: hypothetical protein ABI478_02300 [Propionivibrio sp.]